MDGVDDVESIGISSVKVDLRCRRKFGVHREDKVQDGGGLCSIACHSVVTSVIPSVPVKSFKNPLTTSF